MNGLSDKILNNYLEFSQTSHIIRIEHNNRYFEKLVILIVEIIHKKDNHYFK